MWFNTRTKSIFRLKDIKFNLFGELTVLKGVGTESFINADVDVIGTSSSNAEIELIQIIKNVFIKLQLPNHTIQINNRKILYALIDSCDEAENFEKIAVIIDKLDKVGKDKVLNELKEKFNNPGCTQLFTFIFNLSSDVHETISWLEKLIGDTTLGKEGIHEVKYITSACNQLDQIMLSLI